MWLGDESPSTTDSHVEADLAMKQRALNKVQPEGLAAPVFGRGASQSQSPTSHLACDAPERHRSNHAQPGV
jgi:hypothetical protein